MSHAINILIAGATGVGKSTLVNYLFNEPLRKTGVGKPVTERGFFTEKKTINNTTVYLTDSWGIEADKVDEWTDDFSQYLKKHAIESGPNHWLHTVIYCINAANSRVQPFDIQVLQMLKEHYINPVVVFTKSHALDQDEQQQLQEVITKTEGLNDIPTAFVNSKKVQNRIFTIDTFGKEDIFKAIQKQYINQLDGRLRLYVEHQIDQLIKATLATLMKNIKKRHNLGLVTLNIISRVNVQNHIEKALKKLEQDISTFLSQTLQDVEHSYNFFSHQNNLPKFIMSELLKSTIPGYNTWKTIEFFTSLKYSVQNTFLKEAENIKLNALEYFDQTYQNFKEATKHNK